jgi:hypothetical protein
MHNRMLLSGGTLLKHSHHFDQWNQFLNMLMRVCYLECHEAGLCCYLLILIENLLSPLQLLYLHLWPIYLLSLVIETSHEDIRISVHTLSITCWIFVGMKHVSNKGCRGNWSTCFVSCTFVCVSLRVLEMKQKVEYMQNCYTMHTFPNFYIQQSIYGQPFIGEYYWSLLLSLTIKIKFHSTWIYTSSPFRVTMWEKGLKWRKLYAKVIDLGSVKWNIK